MPIIRRIIRTIRGDREKREKIKLLDDTTTDLSFGLSFGLSYNDISLEEPLNYEKNQNPKN